MEMRPQREAPAVEAPSRDGNPWSGAGTGDGNRAWAAAAAAACQGWRNASRRGK
ncbi:hypothetical protein SAY86_029803 [Trapa natans]|uniref:Uncharacterized protein n=1 Tax=Trapa natans TaxID=22666 RepID=A0AAN7RC91_TRANT|nr:hypothetical protein SAY86_029803 [Trapa natans]